MSDLKLNKIQLKELFNFAASHTHFLFNGCFYDQIDGVATRMGSPLVPVLANFFMSHYEKLWLDNYNGPKVLYYRRYVDNIICLFKNSEDAIMFFEYLNMCHVCMYDCMCVCMYVCMYVHVCMYVLCM